MNLQVYALQILLLIFPFYSQAQLFSEVTSGSIATTLADSRSVNFVDVNNDGWQDIFISNGLNGGQDNLLYLNQGDGTFSLQADNPIGKDNSPSVGASFADWDNDGDLDAYVTNWYGEVNQWYENDGTGHFSKKSFFSSLGSFSETASWGDYDGDGFVDLYVTNSDGDKKNFVFRNTGAGSFSRIDTGYWTTETDLSRNANWTDYDLDGDMDLYVSNENNRPNDLYKNDSTGAFIKVGGPVLGSAKSSMTSSWGDVDNDGDLDLFVGNAGYFQEQNNLLYLRDGDSYITVTADPVVTDGGCTYGSNFGDYDNDGDLDLIVSNGYCNSQLANFLYENQGDGTFVRADAELPNLPTVCSYGAAWGDINNDGFLDLMMANCKNGQAFTSPANSLYLNNGNGNNWVKIHLEGVLSNRAAIGAKIRLKAQINGQAVWQLREVSAQSGYSGQNSLTAHFGLGNATVVDSLIIEWPSGIINTQTSVTINQLFEVVEDNANSIDLHRSGFRQMQCFPMPVEHLCQVEVEVSPERIGQPLTLRVMNTLGQQLWEEELQTSSVHIRTSFAPMQLGILPGVYWLHASMAQDRFSQQIVIK
ncbi:MAG: CRTAC1 family protein [Bacteroidota bacterium]